LPSPTEQKQPVKEETDKNLQKSKQQIFTQSQQSHPNYQQQTNVTTTTYTQNQQIQVFYDNTYFPKKIHCL